MGTKNLWPINVYEEHNVVTPYEINSIKQFVLRSTPKDFSGSLYFTHSLPSISSTTPELTVVGEKLCDHMQNHFLDICNIDHADRTELPELFYIKHMWFNVYFGSGHMFPHDHHEVPFNGTLYITDSSASTVFKNPNPYSYNDFWYSKSTAGKLSIWPGYLEHFVEPNIDKELRITVSFKFEFTFNNIDLSGRRLNPREYIIKLINRK